MHVIVDSTGLKIFGTGQWLEERHGAKTRRQWRKLHIAIDADSGDIVAEVLTDQNTSDVSQLESLLDHIQTPIDQFIADERMVVSRLTIKSGSTARQQRLSFRLVRNLLSKKSTAHRQSVKHM